MISSLTEVTKEIDNAIKLEKNIEAERMSYMTYEMKIREFKQAGYHLGMQDGERKGRREGRLEGAFESTLSNIKMLMKNTHCSAEKALTILEVAVPERKKYLTMLQNS